MRLTEKMCNGEYLHSEASGYSTEICLDKLGQLEDIEEELGIDLLTLFKAIKNGFYAKDELGDIFFISSDMMKKQYEDSIKKLKDFNNDYGKTWALTKEELK